MNKLEELITEKMNEYKTMLSRSCFEEGADFVNSLDLPVKFAEWIEKNNWKKYGDTWLCHGEKNYPLSIDDNEYNTKQLQEYWLNNVYDGK